MNLERAIMPPPTALSPASTATASVPHVDFIDGSGSRHNICEMSSGTIPMQFDRFDNGQDVSDKTTSSPPRFRAISRLAHRMAAIPLHRPRIISLKLMPHEIAHQKSRCKSSTLFRARTQFLQDSLRRSSPMVWRRAPPVSRPSAKR